MYEKDPNGSGRLRLRSTDDIFRDVAALSQDDLLALFEALFGGKEALKLTPFLNNVAASNVGQAGPMASAYGPVRNDPDFTLNGDEFTRGQQANTPALTQFIPGFSATADGKGINVTVNGATILTLALPRQSYNAGQYTAGVAYAAGAKVFGGTADGNTYYAPAAFTATILAADKANGNLVLDVQGVQLQLPSSQVKDATQAKTLDVVIASFNASISALQTQEAKDKANIAAMNTALGNAKVAGFPLTLQ